MANVTTDQIKEALAFIEARKKDIGTLEYAESAISTLGNLQAAKESLEARIATAGAELEKANGEISSLKVAATKQREELAIQKETALASVREECETMRAQIVNGFQIVREQEQTTVNGLIEKRDRLFEEVEGLEAQRASLLALVADAQREREEETIRLKAIRDEMAALKSRL